MMNHIPIFLGPKLECLLWYSDSTISFSQKMVGQLFTSLTDISPSIRIVLIDIDAAVIRDSTIDYTFSDMVSSLASLQIVKTPILPLSEISLFCLSQSTSLETLSSRIDFDPGLLHIPPGFSSLRLFIMIMSSLTCAPSLLKIITSVQLHHVTIALDTLPSERLLHESFRVLMPKISLTTIFFTESSAWHERPHPSFPQSDSYTITSDTLRPLLSLKNLEKVHIRLPCLYDLDDAIIREMALSWPNLNELSLLPVERNNANPTIGNLRVTASGLIPLVNHCHDLKRLSISFDVNVIRVLGEPKIPGRSLSLQTLNVGASRIRPSSQHEVAAYLSGLFTLPRITAWQGVMNDRLQRERYTVWEEVKRLIPYFVGVRMEERKEAAVSLQMTVDS